MTDTHESWGEHWEAYADAFAQPIQSNGLVSRFVSNQNVTGSYAEAWIRSITRNMLGNKFRISTGAVIRPSDGVRGLHQVPQCDLIVWDPSELPGLFECDDFALVPFAAVRAVIEIKRSVSNVSEFSLQLTKRQDLVSSRHVLGVVITPSVATPKPAICGHLKTGHSTDVRDKGFVLFSSH